MKVKRVCYLGAYEQDYPRNLILRRGLEGHGIEVAECRVSPKLNTQERIRALRPQCRAAIKSCDLILLAEFNQVLVPFAWWLARRYRKRLVVDVFTSLYDSAVNDRQTTGAGSLQARRYWLLDWLALHAPDFALVDTRQHKEYFSAAFNAPAGKLVVIPVGASREWFEAGAAGHDQAGTRVLFYGTYIPLHGIKIILRAAHLLRHQPDIRFELIGRGQTFPAIRQLADSLELGNITFSEPVPAASLPGRVAGADICLGIFGTTEKASRVVPNKVYQALALGKPLITADTPALREMFVPGEHLLAVPPGDGQALAEAIVTLADDAALRDRLAGAGRARVLEAYTAGALGRSLLEAISS